MLKVNLNKISVEEFANKYGWYGLPNVYLGKTFLDRDRCLRATIDLSSGEIYELYVPNEQFYDMISNGDVIKEENKNDA